MKKQIGILCIGLLAGCDSEVIEDTKKSLGKENVIRTQKIAQERKCSQEHKNIFE